MEPNPPRTRNPHTQALIARQSFWQVWLPIGLAVLVFVGLWVWTWLPSAAGVRSPIADVSLVLVILVAAFFALIVFALTCALIYGLNYLLRESPFWFKRGQDIVWIVSQQTRSTSRRVTDAVTEANANAAGVRKVFDRFRDLFPREDPRN